MNNQQTDRFKLNSNQKAARMFLIGGGSALAASSIAQGAHAQSATIDTTSVGTQLTSIQTGIVAVGGVLLAMAAGILLFVIGKKVIKKVTAG